MRLENIQNLFTRQQHSYKFINVIMSVFVWEFDKNATTYYKGNSRGKQYLDDMFVTIF